MFSKILDSFIVVGIFVYALTVSTPAQERTGMSLDQTLRANARVNPSTLGMELSIPLGSYPGRGSGSSVSLNYSSKLWRMEKIGRFPPNNVNRCYSVHTPRFAELSAAGWTTDLTAPYIEYTGLDNAYDADGNPVDLTISCAFDPVPNGVTHVRRILVHLPGGTTHELWASSDLIVSQATSGYSASNVSWNGTYYSADGSNLVYEQDSAASPAVYRLKMPDGSHFNFKTSLDYIQSDYADRTIRKALELLDRSGNRISYNSDGSVTDTMGRQLTPPVGLSAPSTPTTGSPETYSVPGLSGSSNINYGLHWKHLEDVRSNTAIPLAYLAYGLPGDTAIPQNEVPLFVGESWERTGADADDGPFNPIVLAQIDLPNGGSYKFRYDKYGRIDKIEYPTGAIETFEYEQVPTLESAYYASNQIPTGEQANFGVTERSVTESTGATPLVWQYGVERTSTAPFTYVINTDAPDDTRTRTWLNRGGLWGLFGFDNALGGRTLEEWFLDTNDNVRSKKIFSYDVLTHDALGVASRRSHGRLTKVENVIIDPVAQTSLSSSTTTGYVAVDSIDDPLLPNAQSEYGFTTSIGNLGTLEKVTETDYLSDSNYASRNLRSLPTEIRIEDASGNPKSKTQFSYDESEYQMVSTGTMPTAAVGSWIDLTNSNQLGSTVGSKRGMPTSVRSYYELPSNYIETHTFFDQFGNPTKSRDGRGNDTTTVFDDDYAFAYPTSVTTPAAQDSGGSQYGSTSGFTSYTSYDYNTGLPLTVTDPNNAVTKLDYEDPMLRPTKVTTAYGTSLAHQTITEYGAGTSAATRWVKTRSQIDAEKWKEAYVWYDGLGRTIRTQSVDDDGDVYVLSCYDNMGRVLKATNPFRGYTTQDCSTTSGLEWTTNSYDPAGRPWKITTPDGAIVETTYGLAATSGYLMGTVVTVEDQAGKQRRSITNALGQLKRVDEPTTSGTALGALTTPNQKTEYDYDLLNNLTTVTQGSQTRTFSYDALSRLKTAVNPESGTITYAYDFNGNLWQKDDARGVRTSYVYDRLNRVTNRNYTTPGGTPSNYQATPDVSYYYDLLTNAKGKLIKVESSVSTTEYTSFDILGRVTESKQTTDGGATGGYTSGYAYNLSGALIEQQYPSGRKVQNTLDQNGDLEMVRSRKNANSGYWAYANNFSYNAAGAVTGMQLGNGRWESTTFNSRLQPTQIALGVTPGTTNLLHLDYSYGTTANNGNVLSQTINVASVGQTNGFTAVQAYSYDSLNRLKDATENITPHGGSQTQSWKQTYQFDRYGNRRFDFANSGTTVPGSNCTEVICNPSIDISNNRLSSSTYTYNYDAAGNTTRDVQETQDRKFTYDAENKQVKVESLNSGTNTSTGTIGEYFYDGDGKRVKKHVPSIGETTVFVYDAGGKLIEEYSTIVAPTNDAKVGYVTNDHLGSPRINTDANGAVAARHDYRPFGEQIASSQRHVDLGYADDTVRKQFTGYERDKETELDFAEARNYSSVWGRFVTTDPSSKSIQPGIPQTWNRYSYCYNNPLNLVDKNGKWPTKWHDYLIAGSFKGLSSTAISQIQKGSHKTDTFSDGKPASTLWPSEAYKHAMVPAGMTGEDARRKAIGFLNEKIDLIRSIQKEYKAGGGAGISLEALFVLGEATHVYEDMTSPEHGFDKTYDIPRKTVTFVAEGFEYSYEDYDLSEWKRELDEHSARENRQPTGEEAAQTMLYSRAFFLNAFGEEEFSKLEMTDGDRRAARELAARY